MKATKFCSDFVIRTKKLVIISAANNDRNVEFSINSIELNLVLLNSEHIKVMTVASIVKDNLETIRKLLFYIRRIVWTEQLQRDN